MSGTTKRRRTEKKGFIIKGKFVEIDCLLMVMSVGEDVGEKGADWG